MAHLECRHKHESPGTSRRFLLVCTTRQPAEAIAKKKVLDEQRCLLNTCKWAATWHKQQSDCAPSEDSDQPGHPPSLIRVFAVRMKKVWVLSYPLSAREDSDQTGWMPRLIWVFARRTVTLLVLSCRGSNYNLFEVLGLTTYLFYFIYLFILFFYLVIDLSIEVSCGHKLRRQRLMQINFY